MASFKHPKELNDYDFVLAVNNFLINQHSIHYAKTKLKVTPYSYEKFYHRKTRKLISDLVQDYEYQKKFTPINLPLFDQLPRRAKQLQVIKELSTQVEAKQK
ncbi:MAG TPA: hypothetical protein V6C58_24690 [Allocoleopsis sp.]